MDKPTLIFSKETTLELPIEKLQSKNFCLNQCYQFEVVSYVDQNFSLTDFSEKIAKLKMNDDFCLSVNVSTVEKIKQFDQSYCYQFTLVSPLYALQKKFNKQFFSHRSAKSLIYEIAAAHGIYCQCDFADKKISLVQDKQTDFEVLQQICHLCGLWFYFSNHRLMVTDHFSLQSTQTIPWENASLQYDSQGLVYHGEVDNFSYQLGNKFYYEGDWLTLIASDYRYNAIWEINHKFSQPIINQDGYHITSNTISSATIVALDSQGNYSMKSDYSDLVSARSLHWFAGADNGMHVPMESNSSVFSCFSDDGEMIILCCASHEKQIGPVNHQNEWTHQWVTNAKQKIILDDQMNAVSLSNNEMNYLKLQQDREGIRLLSQDFIRWQSENVFAQQMDYQSVSNEIIFQQSQFLCYSQQLHQLTVNSFSLHGDRIFYHCQQGNIMITINQNCLTDLSNQHYFSVRQLAQMTACDWQMNSEKYLQLTGAQQNVLRTAKAEIIQINNQQTLFSARKINIHCQRFVCHSANHFVL